MLLSPLQKILILLGLACLGVLVYVILDVNNVFSKLQDGKAIQMYVESLGYFGPVVIVLLMTSAILVSPLPSAPIAIAAGAVYGHFWGTIYVIIGSVSGAAGAFCVSRCLGYEYINKLLNDYKPLKFSRSQDALMGFIFVSRLIPFLSFDVISYAAGLTPIVFWRFFLATLVGIAPASFFLAHVGSEMASAELSRIGAALLLLAALTVLTFLFKLIKNKFENNRKTD